jgi:hypothetical protein
MLFIWTILLYTNNLIDLTNSQHIIQVHIDESEYLSDLVDTLRNILPEIGDSKTALPQHL